MMQMIPRFIKEFTKVCQGLSTHLGGEVAAGHDARLEVALLRHKGGVAGGAPAGEHRHLLQVVEEGRQVADERPPRLVQADGRLEQRTNLLRVAALTARRLNLLACKDANTNNQGWPIRWVENRYAY
eukprot:6911679-Pyramimonas_sp.AAC.1